MTSAQPKKQCSQRSDEQSYGDIDQFVSQMVVIYDFVNGDVPVDRHRVTDVIVNYRTIYNYRHSLLPRGARACAAHAARAPVNEKFLFDIRLFTYIQRNDDQFKE